MVLKTTIPRIAYLARHMKPGALALGFGPLADDTLDRVTANFVELSKRLAANNPASSQQTLFTKAIQAQEENKMSFGDIQKEAKTPMVAGTATTAVMLTYIIWAVCRHPEIKATLVKELQTLPRDYEETHLRGLPFLGHVISEAQCLYTAVPSGLPRVLPPGGAKLGGTLAQREHSDLRTGI